MTTFAQRLAARNTGLYSTENTQRTHLDQVSFESELHELVEKVDANVGELQELSAEIDQHSAEIEKSASTVSSLNTLVDQTVDAYGPDGIDEQGAELMQLSVEALLKAAGLVIPIRTIVPSFEDSASRVHYTTEAVEQKAGIVSKLMTWLVAAIKALGQMLRNFWTRIQNSEESIEEYAKKVAAKLPKLGEELRDGGSKVNLGSDGKFLVDRDGKLNAPDHHVVECSGLYKDFIQGWSTEFGCVTDDVLKKSIEEGHFAGKMPGETKMEFIVGHFVEVTPGSRDKPMIGAKVRIDLPLRPKEITGEVLSKKDMEVGLSTIEAAMKELALAKKASDMVGFLNGKLSEATMNTWSKASDGESGEALRETMRAIDKILSIYTWGLTNTVPYYLKVIKASIGYIDASANHYTTK